MDKTDLFSAFVVYLDQKAKTLEEFQKHLMHLEVRLALFSSIVTLVISKTYIMSVRFSSGHPYLSSRGEVEGWSREAIERVDAFNLVDVALRQVTSFSIHF